MFTWKGKDYQTNIKGEPYVKNPKRIPGTGSNFTKKPDMPPARGSATKISKPKASGVKDVAPISKDKSSPKGSGGDQPLSKSAKSDVKIKPQKPALLSKNKGKTFKLTRKLGPSGYQGPEKMSMKEPSPFNKLMDTLKKSKEIRRKRRSGTYV